MARRDGGGRLDFALVIGGVLASVLTAVTSAYSAYRAAKHEARPRGRGVAQAEPTGRTTATATSRSR